MGADQDEGEIRQTSNLLEEAIQAPDMRSFAAATFRLGFAAQLWG